MFAIEDLVKKDSQRPDVAFLAVEGPAIAIVG